MTLRSRILAALTVEPQTPDEYAAALGIERRKVGAHLAQLFFKKDPRVGRVQVESPTAQPRYAYFRVQHDDPDAAYRRKHKPDPMAPLFLDLLKAHA